MARKKTVFVMKNDKWKKMVLLMRTGEWMSMPYIMEATGLSRKQVRQMIQLGMEAGVLEKRYEKWYHENFPYKGHHRKNFFKKRGGWLERKVNYYRLDMSKLNIEIK